MTETKNSLLILPKRPRGYWNPATLEQTADLFAGRHVNEYKKTPNSGYLQASKQKTLPHLTRNMIRTKTPDYTYEDLLAFVKSHKHSSHAENENRSKYDACLRHARKAELLSYFTPIHPARSIEAATAVCKTYPKLAQLRRDDPSLVAWIERQTDDVQDLIFGDIDRVIKFSFDECEEVAALFKTQNAFRQAKNLRHRKIYHYLRKASRKDWWIWMTRNYGKARPGYTMPEICRSAAKFETPDAWDKDPIEGVIAAYAYSKKISKGLTWHTLACADMEPVSRKTPYDVVYRAAQQCTHYADFERKHPNLCSAAEKHYSIRLLGEANWQRAGGTADNMIYLWHEPVRDIYKVGVTSDFMDDYRIKKVARCMGQAMNTEITPVILRLVSTTGSAKETEKRLKKIGTKVKLPKFDGSTEFRRFTDADLIKAKQMIDNAIKLKKAAID